MKPARRFMTCPFMSKDNRRDDSPASQFGFDSSDRRGRLANRWLGGRLSLIAECFRQCTDHPYRCRRRAGNGGAGFDKLSPHISLGAIARLPAGDYAVPSFRFKVPSCARPFFGAGVLACAVFANRDGPLGLQLRHVLVCDPGLRRWAIECGAFSPKIGGLTSPRSPTLALSRPTFGRCPGRGIRRRG